MGGFSPGRRCLILVACLVACLRTLEAAVLHSDNEADWHFRTSIITPEESAELREEVREMVCWAAACAMLAIHHKRACTQ